MTDDVARGGDGRSAAALRAARAERQTDDVAARELLSGESWKRYCEALLEAGRHIFETNADASPTARAAGAEYLLGLVRAGIGQALELADPASPRFFRNPDSASRWGAENADNQYLWARIDPAANYRIHGTRGTAFEFLIETKEGYMQLGDERNFATLRSGKIACDADGHFEIALSREPRPGNWLPLHPDSRYVAIRQFFGDWRRETPTHFAIERTEEEPLRDPLNPARASALLTDAGEWTLETARFFSRWTDQLRDAWHPGEIAPARKFAGGADDIYYGNDYYRLAPGEALLVETELPAARYWQFQLCDLWFRSADWTARQTSLNHLQAAIDDDGSFRCVVSPSDPGIANWLDTGGELEGVLQYRWIWSQTNPRPTARIVSSRALAEILPVGTRRVSPAERRAALAVRRRHRALREPVT